MNPLAAFCETTPALCAPEKWAIFLRPEIWEFLGRGLLITLRIALVAALASLFFGTLFALARSSGLRFLSLPATAYVEAFRALPVLFLIFFTFFAAARARLGLSAIDAATLALILYTTAVSAEIIRAGILSVDRGQREAARSLGLTYWGMMRYVVLPQAFRRIVPPQVGQLITLVKDTSLVGVLGINELAESGKLIYTSYFNPIQALLVVALIYFAINFTLSRLSRRLEAVPAERRRQREPALAPHTLPT
ncbi:MAG: amino acid ABC transporter permease [Chloroflexi bacterium]|nr:amino acid ABC transporter permease [Chloroflexota bacterium]